VAHLGGQPLVAQHEGRPGQADAGHGDVLHLDQHVDGAVEIGHDHLLGRLRRRPQIGSGQLAQAGDAGRRAVQEQDVARQERLVAADVGDPVATPVDGNHPHADRHRQLEVGQLAVGKVRALAEEHAMGDLLRLREVGHQLPGNAQSVTDDAGDVDRGVADPFDGRDHLEHRRHGVGLLGRPGSQDTDRPHVVDEVVEPLFEVLDLLRHLEVAEVHRCVAQVDHELRGVLRLRDHGP
jgi:hypothetical protein